MPNAFQDVKCFFFYVFSIDLLMGIFFQSLGKCQLLESKCYFVRNEKLVLTIDNLSVCMTAQLIKFCTIMIGPGNNRK